MYEMKAALTILSEKLRIEFAMELAASECLDHYGC